jgi:hypothetical protein
MTLLPLTGIIAVAFVLAVPQALRAQQVTSMDNLSLRSTVIELLRPLAAAPVGEAVAIATAIEVATTPLGTSSGGFVFKLDPVTGLQVRTATTFGPSFAERALTAGEGKVSVGATFSVATYDKLNDLNLSQMQLSRVEAASDFVSRTGNASMVLTSETLVMSGAIGATDNLDIGVAVPMVKVKLDGISWVATRSDVIAARATGAGIASGLGDVAVSAKFRFLKFGAEQPDPGGLAFMLVTRLPTGNRENFRGLGIVRSLGSILFSSGKGKLRPHANGGFEWWEKGLVVPTEVAGEGGVEVRHQIQYAAGLEFEAAPKLTLNVDVLGRHIRGGGQIENRSLPIPIPNNFQVTSFEAVTSSAHGIRKITLIPGFKWNMRGTFLFSFNALVPLMDNSLYDKFTPVIGLDWTF